MKDLDVPALFAQVLGGVPQGGMLYATDNNPTLVSAFVEGGEDHIIGLGASRCKYKLLRVTEQDRGTAMAQFFQFFISLLPLLMEGGGVGKIPGSRL
jgi:hypothetical protein